MLNKILNFIKKYWKRGLVLALLVAAGSLSALTTYHKGFEFGRIVGHCELACSAMASNFSGFEYEGTCQCESASGYIFTLPIDHSFFN